MQETKAGQVQLSLSKNCKKNEETKEEIGCLVGLRDLKGRFEWSVWNCQADRWIRAVKVISDYFLELQQDLVIWFKLQWSIKIWKRVNSVDKNLLKKSTSPAIWWLEKRLHLRHFNVQRSRRQNQQQLSKFCSASIELHRHPIHLFGNAPYG